MLNLVTEIIFKYIRGWFLIHTLFNLVTRSIIIPLLNNNSVINITNGNIYDGIIIMLCYLLLTIIVNKHNQTYLEYYKMKFKIDVRAHLFDRVNCKIMKSEWDKIRLCEKDDLDTKRSNYVFAVLFFIQPLMVNVIELFPFIGYTAWLLYYSPLTVTIYTITIIALIKYLSCPIRLFNEYISINNRLSFLYSDQFRNIIHHNENSNHEKIIGCIRDLEYIKGNDLLAESTRSEYIKIGFNIAYCINLILFASQMTDIATVILYIQYTNLISNSICTFSHLHKQYHEAKIDYNTIEDLLSGCGKKQIVPQLKDFNEITVSKLSFTYLRLSSDQPSFQIKIRKPIILKKGEIIRLDGNSGNGKSTLFDIMCGVISSSNYKASIMYDGIYNEHGFDAITTIRCYIEQFETTRWNTSIYEIITGHENNTDLIIKENIWTALKMAQCSDFLRQDEADTELMSIYSKNILSGGQKARVSIARTIYNIIINKPRMVVLDEIDKAVQGHTVKIIMELLFDYCRKHGIICLVSAHSRESKELFYDQTIVINKGIIE